MKLADRLRRAGELLRDLVFVPLCPVCREPGDPLCPDCAKKLDAAFSPLEIFRSDMTFDSAISSFDFADPSVRELIYRLKRVGSKNSVTVCRDAAARAIRSNSVYLSADVITWVPRDPKSVRYFGFDQAKLLAESLSGMLGIECEELLIRTKKTVAQKKLDRRQRKENVKDAFNCPVKRFGGEVLLVDDMITTGSTVSAASSALKKAGFDKVLVLSPASADKRKQE